MCVWNILGKLCDLLDAYKKYHKQNFDFSADTLNQMELIREERKRKEDEAKKEKRWSFVAPHKKNRAQTDLGPLARRNMNVIQNPELPVDQTLALIVRS
jgi:hypothetical protein